MEMKLLTPCLHIQFSVYYITRQLGKYIHYGMFCDKFYL